jgi:hypothetical protein
MPQRVVTVRRPVTVLLLLLTTIGIVAVTMWLSGKSYSKVDPIPFEDLHNLRHVMSRHVVSTHILAVSASAQIEYQNYGDGSGGGGSCVVCRGVLDSGGMSLSCTGPDPAALIDAAV